MCIRYQVEFWLPTSEEDVDRERKVKRGLVQPGTNPLARVVPFYECKGRLFPDRQCPDYLIRWGGTYKEQILDFCYEDDDCFLRIKQMEAAYTRAGRYAQAVEAIREGTTVQNHYTQAWKKAYDDWCSIYEHHKDCPWKRYNHILMDRLKSRNILQDQPFLDDDTRLGRHPNTAEDPVTGVNRHYDEYRPRR